MRLFTYAGRPDLTSYWVRKHVIDNYNLREFPGDEDSGAMGSMFVWSAAGIFPNAGTDLHFLNAPLFNKSTWRLPGGKTFVIDVPAKNASYSNAYIQSAWLNGQPLNRAWIRHSEIIEGGTLTLTVGPTPSTWGQGADQLPPMARNYQDWATLYAGVTNPLDDADGDGIPNLIEYAVHSNPNSATDNHGIPRLGTTLVGTQRVVTLSFDPSVAAIDLRYEIEYSTDGGQTWSAAGPAQVVMERTGGPVRYRETAPGTAPWMRLKTYLITNSLISASMAPNATDYLTWRTQHFPGNEDPAVVGPDADPDGDGVPNAAEFAFGTIPTSASSVPLMEYRISDAKFEMKFTPQSTSGLVFLAVSGGDLLNGMVASNITPQVVAGQPFLFDETFAPSNAPQQFMGLKVQPAP